MQHPGVKSDPRVLMLAGILLGSIIYFSPGSIMVFIFLAFFVFFANRIPDLEERRFLLRLFFIAFGTRILVTLLLMSAAVLAGHVLSYYPRLDVPDYATPSWLDDSGYYTLRAQYTSMYWLGKPLSSFTMTGLVHNLYGITGMVKILAVYFNVFGYGPVSSHFINCFLGSITAVVAYYIAREIFNRKSARITAWFVVFFPSSLLWSTTNLKETGFVLFVYLMLYSAIRLAKTARWRYAFFVGFSILGQSFFRSGYKEIPYICIAVIVTYFVFLFIVRMDARGMVFVVLLICAFTLFAGYSIRGRINNLSQRVAEQAIVRHAGMLSETDEEGKAYRLLSQEQLSRRSISPVELVNMITLGFLNFMLQPLPWQSESLSMFFSVPQMLLWYVLLFFFVIGIFVSLRYRIKESAVLLVYFIFISLILGATGGNIGTTFRFRDVIAPIVIIFAVAGIMFVFRPKDLLSADAAIL